MEGPKLQSWVDHDALPAIKLRRMGNRVDVRLDSPMSGPLGLALDSRLYYHPLFEHDNKWVMDEFQVYLVGTIHRIEMVFESLHDRTKTIRLADMEQKSQHGEDGAQTVSLLTFKGVGDVNAEVAMGHVGAREFRRAMHARIPDWDPNTFRYEYAVFRDDESVVFNVRPDEADAKPITIAYFGQSVDQL